MLASLFDITLRNPEGRIHVGVDLFLSHFTSQRRIFMTDTGIRSPDGNFTPGAYAALPVSGGADQFPPG